MESLPVKKVCGTCYHLDRTRRSWSRVAIGKPDMFQCCAPTPMWVYGHGEDNFVEENENAETCLFHIGSDDEQQPKVQGDGTGDT